MKKTVFIFAFFLFISAFLHSQQENIFNYRLNLETMTSFRETCRHLSEKPFVRGNFLQEKTISRFNRSLKSSGNFIIAADMGMIWDTLNPFPSTLVLGKDFMIQSRQGGQRTVLNAQGNEFFLKMAEVISAVFTGNAQRLLDNFEVFYLERNGLWELALIPSDSAINSFANTIMMSGDTVIRSIQIKEKNNDTIKYTLSNHSFPGALNANENALFTIP